MTYFPDLAPLDYFTPGESFNGRLRAVGWLSPDHPYQTGEVPDLVIDQLLDLLEDGLPLFACLGFHPCLFCGSYSDAVVKNPDNVPAAPTLFLHGNVGRYVGAENLWLPAEDAVYVAPDMVLHYIKEHRYRPPDEYLRALSTGPRPGSAAYEAAMMVFAELVRSRP